MLSKGEAKGLARAVVEFVRKEFEPLQTEIADLKRQVAGLVERDARRLEIIKEAVETAKGRSLVTKAEQTNTEPAEHGGQT